MGAPASTTLYGEYGPFDLQVARGQIAGHRAVFRSAYSNSITTGQNYAVWPRATGYTFPVSASVMTLSSSATGDVGQLVRVLGLDATYAEIDEVLTLNGQTAVTSTKAFLRINEMQVLTDTPTGNLYFGTGVVTAGVPANVYGFIFARDNSQLAAFYTVPLGHTLYITGGSVNASLSNLNKIVTLNFNSILSGVDYKAAKIVTTGGFQYYPYTPPLGLPEKSDLLDLATTTDAQTSSVTVNLSGYLIKNEIT